LELPNIQELEKNEQYSGWLENLKLFSYGTYQDYKARSESLPKLSVPQETKLKYLSLATLARSSRLLPYSRLQEALDIHVIRDLEDLIIDAMYQDVIRGKLDQQRSTFEVEWTMGRDMKAEEVQNLLAALGNWSRMTGALLEAMDKKIKKIKVEQAETDSLRNKNNATLRENVKEISEKIQPTTAQRSARKGRPGESIGGFNDPMDIDERGITSGPGTRGPGSASTSAGPTVQEQSESPSKLARKRNRGT